MKLKKVLPLIFFAILITGFLLLGNFSLNFNSKQNKPSQLSVKEVAKVLKVVDGDTIEVGLDSKKETVRLIGIDSPEVLDERKPVECFGKEASAKTKEILTGKTVTLESDPTQEDRDEYARLLRYVFLENGTFFNKFMISEGFAREYTFKGNFYRYQLEFVRTEERAKKENKGLWKSC